MTFSIITPSFKQLDWLRLCVASIRDQVWNGTGDEGRESGAESRESRTKRASEILRPSTPPDPRLPPTLCVEHIIQDAGSPGIEDFAREIGADFYRDGALVFASEGFRSQESEFRENNPRPSTLPRSRPLVLPSGLSCEQAARPGPAGHVFDPRPYRISIHCEADSGMYDAVNRGFRRATGEVFAYLNCDEQYLPGTLTRVAGLFDENPQTEVLFCDAIVVDAEGGYLCDRRVMVPSRLHTLVSGNLSVFTSSTFCRDQVFSKRGLFFDTSFKNVGDAEWALRLITNSVSMEAVRLRASAFTDTGDNLNMQPSGLLEKEQLRGTAPRWARIFAPLIVALYRLRRLLAGIYNLPPHTYEIFTRESPETRIPIEVEKPSFHWPGR